MNVSVEVSISLTYLFLGEIAFRLFFIAFRSYPISGDGGAVSLSESDFNANGLFDPTVKADIGGRWPQGGSVRIEMSERAVARRIDWLL